MTLAYKLDLDILLLYLHAEIQVCPFGRESGNRPTDTHTHTPCQNYQITFIVKDGCHLQTMNISLYCLRVAIMHPLPSQV